MNSPSSAPSLPTPTSRLETLDALRDRHTELLKRYYRTGETSEVRADIRRFLADGRDAGKLLENAEERMEAQRILDHWSTQLWQPGEPAPEATLEEFDANQLPELAPEACPYVGLDPFREDAHERFFGRDQLLAQCVEVLKAGPLLAVVGQSGSGKSSAVLGGLIPGLKRVEFPQLSESSGWTYLPAMVPGSDPFDALARILQWVGLSKEPPEREAERLLREPGRLNTLTSALPGVVIVIDQFEELFTLCDDKESAPAFIRELHAFATSDRGVRKVILTMRSEFETWIAREPKFYRLFKQAQIHIDAMDPDELREAIEEPARRVGLRFQEGVVDALLRDTLGVPASLPMLQFTLLKLWERRDRNRILLSRYDELDGARLALAKCADDFYRPLSVQDQEAVRRVLLRMVRVGEGFELHSQRVKTQSLLGLLDRNRIENAIEGLRRERLVRITGEGEDEQIEVAHEALIRNWPTLQDWIREQRDVLLTRRVLHEQAAEWVRRGRGAEGLLTEATLRDAEQWLRSPAAGEFGYHETLPAFVAASRAAVDRERERVEHERLELALERERERERVERERLALALERERVERERLELALERERERERERVERERFELERERERRRRRWIFGSALAMAPIVAVAGMLGGTVHLRNQAKNLRNEAEVQGAKNERLLAQNQQLMPDLKKARAELEEARKKSETAAKDSKEAKEAAEAQSKQMRKLLDEFAAKKIELTAAEERLKAASLENETKDKELKAAEADLTKRRLQFVADLASADRIFSVVSKEEKDTAPKKLVTRRQETAVQYWSRPDDDPRLPQIIRELGFTKFQEIPSRVKGVKINVVLYGSKASVFDVKLIAAKLLLAGVELRTIRRLRGEMGDTALIQIARDISAENKPPLTADQIQMLTVGSEGIGPETKAPE
jgi:hypothetical protein